MRKSGNILLALAVAAVAAGCSGGQGDVNRVQPNYYPKSQFQGEWYYRDTVIDVPFESAILFEGYSGALEKIRWEVQEKALIAYRVNPHVLGADGATDTGKPEFEPVAAWAISSHFDIVRDYNPATGEQTNVLVENTSDRPWWEREYMRVDWSRNIIGNYAMMQAIMGALSVGNGADYWVQAYEEDNPDRVEVESGYIGIVGKYNMLADFNACYAFVSLIWGSGDTSACLPTTVKIRSSFLKVDANHPRAQPLSYPDEEPLTADLNGDGTIGSDEQIRSVLPICTSAEANGDCSVVNGVTQRTYVECTPDVIAALNADEFYKRYHYTQADCAKFPEAQATYFGKFGFFRTEHPAYDREYGNLEKNQVKLANRWNIWKSNYDKDGNPIPYAQRTPRTLVYYTNPDFPEDLLPQAQEIGHQFNTAFVETVAALQAGLQPKDAVQDPRFKDLVMFEVRPNSCSPTNVKAYVAKHADMKDVVGRVIGSISNLDKSNLERVCAALEYNSDFRYQKNGDLRYSYIYWVDRPQQAGPLGFGPAFADPETGEIINGTAYVYGAGLDRYAAASRDIVQVMRGKQVLDDVISGDTMRAIVDFAQHRDANDKAHLPAQMEDLKNRLHDFELRGNGAGPTPPGSSGGTPPPFNKDELMAALRDHAGTTFAQVPAGAGDARMKLLRTDPEAERALVDTEALLLAGWKPGDPVTDELVQKASPVGFMERQQQIKSFVDRFGGKNCVMLEAFTDPSIIGLALDYDAGDKTDDEIFKDLRAKIFLGVTLHEVGHTVGLRHNFSGSYDALNFFDRFWDVRTKYPDSIEDTLHPKVGDPLATGDDADRLSRCVDRAEALHIPVPSTGECLRAPEYKMSSIMDYGARFNSDFGGLGKYDHAAIRFGYGQLVDVFGDNVTLTEDEVNNNLLYQDYKKIPQWLGAQNITNRKVVSYTSLIKDRMKQIRDRSTATALPKLNATTGACESNCDNFSLGAVEVPYKFCSDEYASYEGRDCKRWDEGANQEEIVDGAIKTYQTAYPFSGFRRDRVHWDPNGWLSTVSTRVLNHFIRSYQFYLYYGRYTENFDLGTDLNAASLKGLNFMGEMMQQPENGWYCKDQGSGKFYNYRRWGRDNQGNWNCGAQFQGDAFNMPLGVGKPQWSAYSNNYYFNIDSIGSAYERRVALSALTVNSAFFFQVDNLDVRQFSLSYYQLYRPEIIDMMNGLITNDYEKYAGHVMRTDSGLVYEPRRLFDPNSAPDSQSGQNAGTLVPPQADGGDYTLGLQAAVYGVLDLTSPWDGALDFNHYLKASVKGAWDDVDWGNIDRNDPNVYVEMTDPNTRKIYTAVNTKDGLSITHELLTQAKDYLVRYWEPAKAALDAAEPGSQAYKDAKRQMDSAESNYRSLLETMDQIRRFNRLIEFGT
jgi:hypothetical protein